LNAAFGLNWRRAPAHTSIRYILQGLEPQAVEQIFRQHAAGLCGASTERELPNRLVEPRVLITVRDEGHGRHVSYCGAS
jgi:hypothetical protein